MCGIAGWVDWRRNLTPYRAVAVAMTRTLAPRGPDAEGLWVSDHAIFGHRRLAVIDIEGGGQPMVRPGRAGDPVVLTFSGEVYNFREIRTELEGHGWHFSTRSDTEVLLRAYQQWGTAAAERLEGMFAFAVWDEHERELVLARDRLGIKPLFYASIGDGIIFGSEPKALLAHPEMTAEVDAEGIAELVAVPRARTPGHGVYCGIREVRPGRVVTVRPSGLHERQYWALEARPHSGSAEVATGRVRSLLEDVVRHQVYADVPVGVLLSGGIDSSVIAAMAVGELENDVASFSVSVPSGPPGSDSWRPDSDDPYADLVAAHLGLAHTVTKLSPEALADGLDDAVRARDLPGWGDLDSSMYLLFRTVRDHCTVALSGETSDEVFGGYTWQLDPRYVDHGSFPWTYGRRQPASLLREEVRRLVRPAEYEADRYREAVAEVPVLPGEDAGRRREREVFHLGLTRWLPALLNRKDRMSMAVGLEVRVPFADHRLAEYLFDVPLRAKTAGGAGKAILRRAAAGLLPPEVVNRPKSAYPACRDPKYLAIMQNLVHDLVADRDAPVFDLIDRAQVRSALSGGGADLPGPITASTPAISLAYLLELDRWLRIYRVRIVL